MRHNKENVIRYSWKLHYNHVIFLCVVRHAWTCPICSEITSCQYLQKWSSYSFLFLQVVRHSWKLQFGHVIFVGFSQASPTDLWNNRSAVGIWKKTVDQYVFLVLNDMSWLLLKLSENQLCEKCGSRKCFFSINFQDFWFLISQKLFEL